jgi:hypothetical protein
MNEKVIGIFYDPWDRGVLSERNLVDLYRKGFQYKANPRDEVYMKNLFYEHFPHAQLVNAQKDSDWDSNLSQANSVILLYPDSIGLGYAKIEKKVFKKKGESASINVLNGRRRFLTLEPGMIWKLRWRRFLERFMVCEFLSMFIFAVVTPIFLLIDFVRGKR